MCFDLMTFQFVRLDLLTGHVQHQESVQDHADGKFRLVSVIMAHLSLMGVATIPGEHPGGWPIDSCCVYPTSPFHHLPLRNSDVEPNNRAPCVPNRRRFSTVETWVSPCFSPCSQMGLVCVCDMKGADRCVGWCRNWMCFLYTMLFLMVLPMGPSSGRQDGFKDTSGSAWTLLGPHYLVLLCWTHRGCAVCSQAIVLMELCIRTM